MNDHSSNFSRNASVATMLATMLRLTAPTSMSPQDRLQWVEDAVDALEGIRPDEVAAVMMEVQRSVTRHNQLVPKICDLVHAKRSRSTLSSSPSPFASEMRISDEARKRRAAAKTAVEIEAAWEWERSSRIEAGLHVPPIAKPFSRYELDNMGPDLVRLGLNSGFLKREGGKLVEVMDVRETDRIRERNRR
jgi:hypothetical protein